MREDMKLRSIAMTLTGLES